MAVIGVPKAYNGLLRELFVHESILISIFGIGSLEQTALNSYDIVIMLNEEMGSTPKKGNPHVLWHPLSKESLGTMLHAVSEEIPQLLAE